MDTENNKLVASATTQSEYLPETIKDKIHGYLFDGVLFLLLAVAVVGGSLCVSAFSVYTTNTVLTYSPWSEDYFIWILVAGGVFGTTAAIISRNEKSDGFIFLWVAFIVSEILALVLWTVDITRTM